MYAHCETTKRSRTNNDTTRCFSLHRRWNLGDLHPSHANQQRNATSTYPQKRSFFTSFDSNNHSTSTMAKAYLLSRTLDPLLAVFTGLFAFYLNQNNPRTAPPPGHTLQELLRWKWAESKKIREARDKEASEEWENVARELVGGASAEEVKR